MRKKDTYKYVYIYYTLYVYILLQMDILIYFSVYQIII